MNKRAGAGPVFLASLIACACAPSHVAARVSPQDGGAAIAPDAGNSADMEAAAIDAVADVSAVAGAIDSGPAAGTDGNAAAPKFLVHLSASGPMSGDTDVRMIPGEGPLGQAEFNSADAVHCPGGFLTLPATVACPVVPGSWRIIAAMSNGGAVVSGGIACDGNSVVTVKLAAGAVTAKDIDIHLGALGGQKGGMCGDGGQQAAPKGFLQQLDYVATPPTAAGGPHLLKGLVWNERLWIAGSQDGFVSFDFPAASKPAPPLQNWTVYGEPFCNRLAHNGNRLFCSSRTGAMHVLTVDPQTQTPIGKSLKVLDSSLRTEGMAARGDVLYVASHAAGLIGMSEAPPFDALPLKSPPQLNDTWDVAVVGSDLLAVADGEAGLRILALGTQPLAPQVVSTLALPGRAAFLSVQGDLVVVGALGGGVHVVNVAQPTAPKWLGSATPPGDVYGVVAYEGHVVAAAGHHLVAWDLPGAGGSGPLAIRGALPSNHFAMDVEAFGPGRLLTAEFQSVRRLAIDATAPTGPILVAPQAAYARAVVVGQKIHADVQLTNIGTAPLAITMLRFAEQQGVNQVKLDTPPPLAPGQTITVVVDAIKTIKGVASHELTWTTNDDVVGTGGMMIEESTDLRPGDPLPLLQYDTAAGQLVDVAAHIKGKVGVVLVAAHRCPVAFYGLASAGTALAPLLLQGGVAAVAIDPWDKPNVEEANTLKLPFPVLFSAMTTGDGHDWSEVLDVKLGQPVKSGPPTPVVYVVGKDGKIVLAQWGWETQVVLAAVQAALAAP